MKSRWRKKHFAAIYSLSALGFWFGFGTYHSQEKDHAREGKPAGVAQIA